MIYHCLSGRFIKTVPIFIIAVVEANEKAPIFKAAGYGIVRDIYEWKAGRDNGRLRGKAQKLIRGDTYV